MPDIIIHADIERVMVTYLKAALAAHGRPIQVGSKIPQVRPAEFVKVRLTGGTTATLISDRPTIVVETYAAKEPAAVQLAQLVRGLTVAAARVAGPVAGHTIYQVTEASGLGNLPDPLAPELARYTQTFTVHIRGSVIPSAS